ncbi:unnamed protein product [Cuscuta europaea]|uniref:Reverse transcriptase Ty1/copia-type domain-containing protein n=1 Tax=Cuscuta europaea TaxID=41803 RepID=A0A9P0YLD5_CUSEU|nr:unnamed protein product [Cuscuta europaea]
MITRAKAGIFKPKHFLNLSAILQPSPIPKNPITALRDPSWKTAMDDKFCALIKNRTWELVPRQPDTNIVRCMWLFKHKYRSDGSLERHKARLVENGNSHQFGVDCEETFILVSWTCRNMKRE